MTFDNLFDQEKVDVIIQRINCLTHNSAPNWGKMNSSQMLAHLCVTYDLVFDESAPKAKGLKKWLMKKFIKPMVVNEVPYKRNSPTGKFFLISNERDFEIEKAKLIQYLNKVVALGSDFFEKTDYASFGFLSKKEWNNMFYKHLDHHLRQFGV